MGHGGVALIARELDAPIPAICIHGLNRVVVSLGRVEIAGIGAVGTWWRNRCCWDMVEWP